MNIMETINWMQREAFPNGTIRKWALTQEALPDGVPFMGGFVELFPGATLPLTVDVQARQQEYDAFLLQSALLPALAAHRYAIQNGGLTVAGNQFRTDPESRLALLTVWVVANADSASPKFPLKWKMAYGNFVTLNAQQIIDSGNAVLTFVQQCFDTEEAIKANVANFSTVAAITAAFDQAMAA